MIAKEFMCSARVEAWKKISILPHNKEWRLRRATPKARSERDRMRRMLKAVKTSPYRKPK